MAGKEDNRIFVGGLAWDVTERQLEHAFGRYGKVTECQIMLERDTGRPRGFGFITFSDRRGMEDAIKEMHGRELCDRIISVNRAQPKMGADDVDHGYRGGFSSGGRESYRGSYGGGDRVGQDDCFKCGRPGHWARDCPLAGGGRGGGGGSFSSRTRFGGGGGHGDRFSGERDRLFDDRYDGGRYGERERLDSRDNKYASRDRYASDRYSSFMLFHYRNRYGGSDRYPQNGYGKDKGFDKYGSARGNDRYGSGIGARDEGRSYRSRPGPYDRPTRGGRPSSFDRY
ncbi:glycine-rich RNA-binding protein RZ1B isoform X1 [Senna tora]|uniref:Glycine-rich RNA-binding protein RZ1B isoform X1 n=1 Tax=Senna tora TaxID=362788 RepID=A0A834TF83_9FABA|nr:glycine-rich RNA-binding protein RZ1B isoform X1 [Senna tora]